MNLQQIRDTARFYGAQSTVHDRFQEWQRSGFFEKMWKAGLLKYDNKNGLECEWQAIDGAMKKTPLDGAGTGANPTDCGKKVQRRVFLKNWSKNMVTLPISKIAEKKIEE